MRLRNPSRTYFDLLGKLHEKPFVWFIHNDDNRAGDGTYLRYEFLSERPPAEQLARHDWMQRNCSMLEMLIALSRRLSFLGGGATSEWFWHMLSNIGLSGYSDARPGPPEVIDRALNRVIKRTYEPDGRGGLFPLREATEDQRRVEIWAQMNNYLIERG